MLSVVLVSVAVAAAAPTIVPHRDVTFASLDVPALRPQPVPYDPRNVSGDTFVITASCCGYGPFTPSAVQAASDHYGLFDFPCGWPDMPAVGEWVRAA